MELTKAAQQEILTGRSSERCIKERDLSHNSMVCPACQEVACRERILQSLQASGSRMASLREAGRVR